MRLRIADQRIGRSHAPQQAQTVVAETEVSPIIALHPHIAQEYRRRAAELPELLASTDDEKRHRAAEKIRALVDRVILSPKAGGGVSIEIEGSLAAALNPAAGRTVPADVCLQWCQERTPIEHPSS